MALISSMAAASLTGSAKEIACISALAANREKMFSERIFPPVSGGKNGRGSVSKILIGFL
jgi:hypothetical protein